MKGTRHANVMLQFALFWGTLSLDAGTDFRLSYFALPNSEKLLCGSKCFIDD